MLPASGECFFQRRRVSFPGACGLFAVGNALREARMRAEKGERDVPRGECGAWTAFFVLPHLPG